jgi:DNA-binding beta-propeller fold protein YncE
VDRKEQYFVVMPEENEIRRFGIDGALQTTWGGEGAGPGEFNGPTGIQAGVIGIYVADTGNNRIQRFDAEGAFVLEWGGEGL